MIRPSLAALAIAALIGAAAMGPSPGNAQANCDTYAKIALKQQQDNERLKCGFKGDAWNSDVKAHMTWCAGVSPDQWRNEANKRAQQLATCEKGKK